MWSIHEYNAVFSLLELPQSTASFFGLGKKKKKEKKCKTFIKNNLNNILKATSWPYSSTPESYFDFTSLRQTFRLLDQIKLASNESINLCYSAAAF